MDNGNKQPSQAPTVFVEDNSHRVINIIIAVVVILVGLIILINIFSGDEPTSDSASTDASGTSSETKEYDLSVRQSARGLAITNNESIELTDCNITVNSGLLGGGYTYNTGLNANDETLLAWGLFTDDGKRFNYAEKAPERVSVSSCNGDTRFSYYEW